MSTIPPAELRLRQAVEDLVPYEPGKPADELRRELGIESIVKLASKRGSARTVSCCENRPLRLGSVS